MAVITIPKKITNGNELIVVQKKDWDNLLRVAKDKLGKIGLEKGLKEALAELRTGKIIGPFDRSGDFIKSLEK